MNLPPHKRVWPGSIIPLVGGLAIFICATVSGSISPPHGPVGSLVNVTLTGIDGTGITGARMEGVVAEIASASENSVTLIIPEGARSGTIELLWDEGSWAIPTEFDVTRRLPVDVDAGFSGVSQLGGPFGDAVDGQVEVATGRSTLLFAWDGGEGPVLLAIATDADNAMTFDATTTAQAAVFLSYLVYSADSAAAVERLGLISDAVGFEALAALIEDKTRSGTDYTASSLFSIRLEDALSGYLESQGFVASQSAWGESTVTVAVASEYGIRDLKVNGYHLLDRIEPTTHSGGVDRKTGLPVFRQKFDAAPIPDETLGGYLTANPLEWAANLYRLDEYSSRLDSREEVAALAGSNTAVYPRWSRREVDRLIIGSKPATRYLNVVELAKNWLVAKIVKQTDVVTGLSMKETLDIPADEPGIYMVRAFSGARYPPRDTLVDNLPNGRGEDTQMMALNLVLAVNDAVGIFVSGQKAVSENEWASFLTTLEKNIADALDIVAAQGTLDAAAINAVFQKSATTALGWIWDKTLAAGVRQLPSRLAAVAFSSLDASGKVANAFKLVERLSALSNAVQMFDENAFTVQSVEDSLIVVGDPWAPTISSISPNRGHRGTLVTITGERFSETESENIVTIGAQGTSSSDPPEPARAEVIESSYHSLVIRIPEEAHTGLISVHVPQSGTASTAQLESPFQQFEVIPDPVLMAMEPAVAGPSDQVRLVGEHFPEDISNLHAVFTTSQDLGEPIIHGTSTDLFVNIPSAASGLASLRVVFNGRQSNSIDVSITSPPLPPLGANIQISSIADTDERDGDLTLREALMLANGALAYAALTTVPETGRPDATTTYETDYLGSTLFFKENGDDRVGPGFRNQIVNLFGLIQLDETIELTSALPPVQSWTTIDLRPGPIIDGNGAGVGLLLDGASRVTAFGFHLRDFSEAAIRLSGDSSDNNIWGITINGGTGHGIHLLDNSRRNGFMVSVKQAGGDGYRLEGEGVMMNSFNIHRKPEDADGFVALCDGWGVKIAAGARFNRLIAPPLSFGEERIPSGGIVGNKLGGILVTGEGSTGNLIGDQLSYPGIPIQSNEGPGIRMESPNTLVQFCYLGSNADSGIEIRGSASRGSRVKGCSIGFDPDTGLPQGNGEHGIYIMAADQIGIGSGISNWSDEGMTGLQADELPLSALATADGPFTPPNRIGANAGHGILIEDSSGVSVKATLIGRVTEATMAPVDLPNGLSGLVLQNSHSCELGSVWPLQRVQITGHLNHVGISITGAGSYSNTLIGAFIGCEAEIGPEAIEGYAPAGTTDLGNRFGIEIVNGAYGNRIGLGGRDEWDPTTTPMNRIHFNREAGIVLNSGIDPAQSIPSADSPFTPRGKNVILNNSIRHQHDVGVLIRSEAKANQVGSGRWWEYNNVRDNGKIGIRIEGATATRPELANRILGNAIRGNGANLAAAADPLSGEPEGIGLLLINSSMQQIGGVRPEEANGIYDSWVGVMVVGGSGNSIANNYIGGTRWTDTNRFRHRYAGLLLRDTFENLIGPGNAINGGGVVGYDPLGGLVISGGGRNQVFGNTLTSDNTPDGVLLRETADNLVGGFGGDRNVIGNAVDYGIRITGTASTGNRVSGNWIGRNPGRGGAVQPNLVGGIHVEGGASGNQIGGVLPLVMNGFTMMLPAGNTIEHNGSVGVRISDAAASNPITYNRITSNSGSGITLAGGNNMQSAPVLALGADGFINGTSTASAGSLVQVFLDATGEGKTLLGETELAAGGFTFRLPRLLGAGDVTATVTDAMTGDTSEFSTPLPMIDPLRLLVTRLGEPAIQIVSGSDERSVILPLEFSVGGNSSISLETLTFIGPNGALLEAQLLIGGSIIADGVAVSGEELSFFGAPDLAVVAPGAPIVVEVQARIRSDAFDGQQLQFSLNAPRDVIAQAPAEGEFPIMSDFLVRRFQSFEAWGEFFGVDINGQNRDSLFSAYVSGRLPEHSAHSRLAIVEEAALEGGNVEVTAIFAERNDVSVSFLESVDLREWIPVDPATILNLETMPEGLHRVKIIFPAIGPKGFLMIEASHSPDSADSKNINP